MLKLIGGEARKKSNGMVEGWNTGRKRLTRRLFLFIINISHNPLLSATRTRVLSMKNMQWR